MPPSLPLPSTSSTGRPVIVMQAWTSGKTTTLPAPSAGRAPASSSYRARRASSTSRGWRRPTASPAPSRYRTGPGPRRTRRESRCRPRRADAAGYLPSCCCWDRPAGRWSTCARARRRCPGRAGLRRRRPEADRRQHRRVQVAGTPNQRGDLSIGFRAKLSLPAGRHLRFSITAAPPIAAPPSGCWSSHSCPRGTPTRRSGSPCCRAASSEPRASTAG